MSCSARVPVYVDGHGAAVPASPVQAALLFAGAYALGIVAALAMAWVFKKTLLKGPTRPLVIELPNYRRPSLRNALLLTYDRAAAFVKTAGHDDPRDLARAVGAGDVSQDAGRADARRRASAARRAERRGRRRRGRAISSPQTQLEHSFAGRLGRAIEPVFAPLGFDWKMSVGVRHLVRGTRGDRVDARRALRPGARCGRRIAAVADRIDSLRRRRARRLAGVHRGDLPQPAGVLRPGDAVPADAGRHPPRNRLLEMAAGATGLHDGPGLYCGPCDFTKSPRRPVCERASGARCSIRTSGAMR